MSAIRASHELSFPRCRLLLGSWSRLSADQQQAARLAFRIFKQDPFDPRLRAHKIHRLSAHYGRSIDAVEIAADLRAAFYIEGDTLWSVAIGTHNIYKA